MPKRLHNWTYRDVVRVLREHGFQLMHTRGSHFYYIGTVDRKLHQVCVPYHGSVAIKPRTMAAIIRQSGLSQKAWFS